MGALHDGHISLLKVARAVGAQRVVASVYVNPTQFDRDEDLKRYPRDLDADFAKLEAAGCDAVFVPKDELMYPCGYQTEVWVPEASRGLCGAHRPGHFVGVTTIVTKLLNIIRPSFLVMGEKDFQQLMLTRLLVSDLNLDTQVVGAPVARDDDGLALSSRNVQLSDVEREQARSIYGGLQAAQRRYYEGERSAERLVVEAKAVMSVAGLEPEYLELRSSLTLAPLNSAHQPCRLLVAAYVGSTRLIDNVVIAGDERAQTA